ncbi:MAG: BREX system P-loop protein BrxC [Microbacteriaceae bacterium]|nr:BREX system P-loop protein BrxC [Microbacteriaceae bacterium]
MKLHDIFEKDVTRPIDGVIKADDTTHLGTEVEEYVLTNEAEKALSNLLEEYTNYTNANGVWISGFFGSGKSHLLKMLAHLLGDVDGQDFPCAQVSESFKSKTGDGFLKASLKKAEGIPARSLLFNIDQVADAQGGDKTDAILKVFIKVFNNSRGYYGMQPHVARFERDLDTKGVLAEFKQTYQRIAGMPWSEGRELDVLEEPNVAAAYAEITGAANGAPENILEKYRDSYRVDIDEFASEVVAWVDKQAPGTRLNFFVDEVGQYIGDDTKLMLNLQTIVESLNTKAKGRAWVFVTSQEAIDRIIGDPTKAAAHDFSKIQGRFKTRVSLSSADVEEVIRKRLLEKNAAGTAELKAIHAKESGNFKTLFDFVGGRTYPNYPDEARFISTYPFVNYQFPLFSAALVGLSEHNAFTGRHASVGERSMLGVVQQVAKELDGAEVGQIAAFDNLFAGIRDTVQASTKRSIDVAEKNLPDQGSDLTTLAVRVLKALFLVKYVDGFRATARNLAVLVYDRFGLNPQELTKQVEDALALLESQTYIQRNGDLYEYLTNEEQEIENEIKAVDLDVSEVGKRLFEMLQQDVIKTPKYRYKTPKGDFLDYGFGYKIDDVGYGPQHALTVHFFTPGYPHDLQTIRAHSTGLDELRVVLDADAGLFGDLRLLLKTEKYVKQKQNGSLTAVQQRILGAKAQQNLERKKELLERLRRAIGRSMLIVYTVDIESSSEAADTRVFDGLGVLVTKAYPQLSLLGGKVYTEADIQKFVQAQADGLVSVDTTLTEAANEVYNVGIQQQVNIGQQVTVKALIDKFTGKPYGWDQTSTLVVVAYLFGASRITIEHNGNVLKRTEVPPLLKNTQQLTNLKVGVQKTFDDKKVTAFRKFVTDFFDEGLLPKDALELARFGADKLRDQLARLQEARNAYDYPFIAQLDPAITLLQGVVGKTDEWYLTEFDKADGLLEAKESVLDPIRAFLMDNRKGLYDGVRKFLRDANDNLGYLPKGASAPVQALLDDLAVFRGSRIVDLQNEADALREQIDAIVKDEQVKAADSIEQRRIQLQQTAEYSEAPEAAQARALERVDRAIQQAWSETSIPKLKVIASDFAVSTFPSLVADLAAARPATAPAHSGEEGGATHGDGPAPTPQAKPVVALTSIPVSSAKLVLASAADVDEYVDALRAALQAAIAEGKRITR